MAHVVGKRLDLVGKVFTRLTVVAYNSCNNQGSRWDCICECGNKVTVIGKHLNYGATKSCGCLKIDGIVERSLTHGLTKTAEYRAWRHMQSRCYNKNVDNYKNYGGRGIVVCDRWLNSFENFLQDMGNRPSDKHSLDRKSSNGNYEPSNCKWSTTAEQTRNIRTNHWIEREGKRMILSDWATFFNTTPSRFHYLIKTKSLDFAFDYFKNK